MNSVDVYIAAFPQETQDVLQKIRATIKKVAPEAVEGIGYGVAAYKLGGKPLIYFAGFKKHVSLYPIPEGDAAFRKAIASHVAGKGTLRFPLDKPVDLGLVKQVVEQHVKRRLSLG